MNHYDDSVDSVYNHYDDSICDRQYSKQKKYIENNWRLLILQGTI